MSWMEKGFWVATGGVAGLSLGCMLFDDAEPESTRTGRRIETGGDDGEDVESVCAEASTNDSAVQEVESETVRETMERIGLSLDETMEALKPKTAASEEA